jgi:acyl carrier protein
MEPGQIGEAVREIIATGLGLPLECVQSESQLSVLFAQNSLDVVEVAALIEERFDFTIPADAFVRTWTVRDLARYVELRGLLPEQLPLPSPSYVPVTGDLPIPTDARARSD